MKITTQVTLQEYMQLVWLLVYKKPATIFVTFIGAVILISASRHFAGIYVGEKETTGMSNFLGVLFGLFAVGGIPLSVYRSSKKSYNSNLRLQENIDWDFTNDKVIVSGTSFYSEMDLNKSHKIIELKKWFLIYQNNVVFNLIPKKNMTPIEVTEIRNIFRDLNSTVIKKLKKS